jgi:hypothetical protein
MKGDWNYKQRVIDYCIDAFLHSVFSEQDLLGTESMRANEVERRHRNDPF